MQPLLWELTTELGGMPAPRTEEALLESLLLPDPLGAIDIPQANNRVRYQEPQHAGAAHMQRPGSMVELGVPLASPSPSNSQGPLSYPSSLPTAPGALAEAASVDHAMTLPQLQQLQQQLMMQHQLEQQHPHQQQQRPQLQFTQHPQQQQQQPFTSLFATSMPMQLQRQGSGLQPPQLADQLIAQRSSSAGLLHPQPSDRAAMGAHANSTSPSSSSGGNQPNAEEVVEMAARRRQQQQQSTNKGALAQRRFRTRQKVRVLQQPQRGLAVHTAGCGTCLVTVVDNASCHLEVLCDICWTSTAQCGSSLLLADAASLYIHKCEV